MQEIKTGHPPVIKTLKHLTARAYTQSISPSKFIINNRSTEIATSVKDIAPYIALRKMSANRDFPVQETV